MASAGIRKTPNGRYRYKVYWRLDDSQGVTRHAEW